MTDVSCDRDRRDQQTTFVIRDQEAMALGLTGWTMGGFRSRISSIMVNGILTIWPPAHSIFTLGAVSACVVFMLRTIPRTRVPSRVMISTLSLP